MDDHRDAQEDPQEKILGARSACRRTSDEERLTRKKETKRLVRKADEPEALAER